MKVSIIGPGRIGGGLARLLARSGAEVFLTGYRDEAKARKVLADCEGHAFHGSLDEALAFADVLLLTTVYWQVDAVAAATGGCAGKTVIDTTNSYHEDWTPRPIEGATTSAALTRAKFPRARYAKAFNALPYWFLEQKFADADLPALAVFFGGDDAEAVDVASDLIVRAGFAPFDVGGVANLTRCEMTSPVYGQGLKPSAAAAYLRNPR